MWPWSRDTGQKSQFYVWYLGSKEADGVWGPAVVLPVMRQLLRDALRKPPNKATVQISNKGLKLVQSVLTMTKSGRMKMQLVKVNVAANCIIFSMVGRPPFHDVVGVVMLVLNPETRNPIHVHCYRCDSPDSATMLQAHLQLVIARPENQRAVAALEQRLAINGVIPQPRTVLGKASSEHNLAERATVSVGSVLMASSAGQLPHHLRRKRYSVNDLPSAVSSTDAAGEPRFRMFGDTLVRAPDAPPPQHTRSKSFDGLADASVINENVSGEIYRLVRVGPSNTLGRAEKRLLA